MAFAQDILTRIINIHKKKKPEEPGPENEWVMVCKTIPAGPDGAYDDIVGVTDGGGAGAPLSRCGYFISTAGVGADDPIDPMTDVLWYFGMGSNPQIREVWVRTGGSVPVNPRLEYPPLKPPEAGIPPVVR